MKNNNSVVWVDKNKTRKKNSWKHKHNTLEFRGWKNSNAKGRDQREMKERRGMIKERGYVLLLWKRGCVRERERSEKEKLFK